VSRRSGLGAPREPNAPTGGADPEASAASTAIAGLRWRLRRQSTLDHPAVRSELRQLEQQLAAQFERAGRAPGRHRCPDSATPSQPEPGLADDTAASGSRPDPATARSAQELITVRGH
jgi:hypothetical protein